MNANEARRLTHNARAIESEMRLIHQAIRGACVRGESQVTYRISSYRGFTTGIVMDKLTDDGYIVTREVDKLVIKWGA